MKIRLLTYKKCFLAFMYLIAKNSEERVFHMAYKPELEEINVLFLAMVLDRSDTKYLNNFYSMTKKDVIDFYSAQDTLVPTSWLNILFKHCSLTIHNKMLSFLINRLYPTNSCKPPTMSDMNSTIAKHALIHSTDISHSPRPLAPSDKSRKYGMNKAVTKAKARVAKQMSEKSSKKVSVTKKIPKPAKETFPSKKHLMEIIQSTFTASFIKSNEGAFVYSKKGLLKHFAVLMPGVKTTIEVNHFVFSEKNGKKNDTFAIPKGFKLV